MPTPCLICNSSVVLSKEAAQVIASLIGSLDAFLRGIQSPTEPSAPTQLGQRGPLEQAFNRMLEGLSAVHTSWPDTHAFIKDVNRHQFMDYQCLCLRCGAKYDEPTTSTGRETPT